MISLLIESPLWKLGMLSRPPPFFKTPFDKQPPPSMGKIGGAHYAVIRFFKTHFDCSNFNETLWNFLLFDLFQCANVLTTFFNSQLSYRF